ncbi:MAG: hypothetical protein V1720_10625 [bacterium]
MKIILFKPFDIGKWFALGFTAFLAELIDTPGGGGGGGKFNLKDNEFNWSDIYNFPAEVMEWLTENPFWMAVIIAGIVVAIILYVLFTWLSSRGMFMFLDNVVHNRSLIEKPWREYKIQGNSLFLWRLAFGIISFIIFIGFLVAAFFIVYNIYLDGEEIVSQLLLILGLMFIGFLLFLVVVFISIFLEDFVVPIMYKSGVSVNDAWRKFLSLFGKHVGHFILYGLFIIGLYILIVIGVVVGGLLTCCCGFILLVIPYIGSVLMLPVSVTFRAFSLEFLEQFGYEYKIFPVVDGDVPLVENSNINPVV